MTPAENTLRKTPSDRTIYHSTGEIDISGTCEEEIFKTKSAIERSSVRTREEEKSLRQLQIELFPDRQTQTKETVPIIHEENSLYERTNKTKPTHPSDGVQNVGDLRGKENIIQRADSENELREYKDSENHSRTSSRSSRSSISSRGSRRSTQIDTTQQILNFMQKEREKDRQERERKEVADRIAREKKEEADRIAREKKEEADREERKYIMEMIAGRNSQKPQKSSTIEVMQAVNLQPMKENEDVHLYIYNFEKRRN